MKKIYNMKTKQQKFLSYLSLLSLLSLLKLVTDDPRWDIFLVFLVFIVFTRIKADERFKSNMNKAARNGFITSVLGIIGMALVINSHPTADTLVIALQVCLWVMMIVFMASFTLFDRKGMS